MTNTNDASSSPATSRRDLLLATGLGALGAGALGLGFVRPAIAAADSSTWITQTARFKLNADNADTALAGLKKLVAAVEATEPGVLAYICNRSTKDTNEILFFEIYQDQATLTAHGATPHLGELRTNFATWFQPGVEIVRFDRVAGFSR